MWFWLIVAFLLGQASEAEKVPPPVITDPKTAAVWVSVVDEEGKPVPDAPIGVKRGFSFIIEGKTDDRGRFRFGGLAATTYEFEVFKDGYSSTSKRIELKAGEESEITLALEEQGFFSRWWFYILVGGLLILFLTVTPGSNDGNGCIQGSKSDPGF